MLRAKIVAGGANNQLAHAGVEKLLEDRGILYAPDYVVNAGGVIQVADEIHGFNFDRAKARTTKIYDTTQQILELAAAEGVPPAVAADRLAERRMADAARLARPTEAACRRPSTEPGDGACPTGRAPGRGPGCHGCHPTATLTDPGPHRSDSPTRARCRTGPRPCTV